MTNRIWVRRTEIDTNGNRIPKYYCCRSKSNTCTKAHLSSSEDFQTPYGEGLAEATARVNTVLDEVQKGNDDPGRELSVLVLPNGGLMLAWTVVEAEDCQCADDENYKNIEQALSLS